MTFLLPFLLACTGQRYRRADLTFQAPPNGTEVKSVAPIRFLRDGWTVADPIREGVAIGHITFAGGYATEATAIGQQNASRTAVLDGAERYEADAAAAVLPMLTGLAAIETLPVAPTRHELRGSYSHSGTDNQPLPRFDLIQVPIAAIPSASGAVVVPWIVDAYTHNGGWFFGQTFGSASGARLRVWFGIYDAASGAPLGWTDCSSIVQHDDIMSPNASQVEDLWLMAAKHFGKRCKISGL